jgi:hypothetical protein
VYAGALLQVMIYGAELQLQLSIEAELLGNENLMSWKDPRFFAKSVKF